MRVLVAFLFGLVLGVWLTREGLLRLPAVPEVSKAVVPSRPEWK